MNDDALDRAGFVPVEGDEVPEDTPLVVHDPIPSLGPPPVVVFHGRPKVFFLAICVECNEGSRPIPMPFGTEAQRDTWADGHRSTGHTVNEALEVRPI